MTGLAWLLVIPAALLVWTLISPQSAWRAMTAWRYRNPETHEPSGAGYAMHRVGAVIGLATTLMLAVLIVEASGQAESGRQEREYQDCLSRHQGEDSLLSPQDWCENLSPSPAKPR
jgi:hypothetical protein